MANEPQKTEVALPSYLTQYQGQQQTDADSLASASASVPRVSLRGRQFRFMENGEEVLKANESVDVIILGVDPEAGKMVKVYYDKPYAVGANEPPTCASHDGIRPSAWVQNPQNKDCQTCPKNQFGSAKSPSGKPSKACRDSKLLWVQRTDDDRDTPAIYGLNVTVSSLQALAEYGRKFKAHNLPLSLAITRLTMVDSEFPQLEFACIGFVSEADAPKMLAKSEEKPWKIFQISSAAALTAPESGGGNPSALPVIPAHVQAAAATTAPGAAAASDGKPVDANTLLKNW